MDWALISDIILCSSFAVLAVFAVLGLYQWISRKSLMRVDRSLLCFFIPLILMAITYIVFSSFVVLNTRPDGSGEASFPSSHVMVVATIFLCSALILPRYVENKALIIVIYILMAILLILVCVGRILSNQHWPSDVVAALIFACIFALIYYLSIRSKKHD